MGLFPKNIKKQSKTSNCHLYHVFKYISIHTGNIIYDVPVRLEYKFVYISNVYTGVLINLRKRQKSGFRKAAYVNCYMYFPAEYKKYDL